MTASSSPEAASSPGAVPAMPAERNLFRVALLLASLAAALFIGLASWGGLEGVPVPPLADAYIFQQHARALAEGHPYRFVAEDPPSTGSTSHAYPVVLAAFYKMGLSGNALAPMAMLLGAVCFLASVIAVWVIAQKIAPRAAPLAAMLEALHGQQLYTHLGGTDMALFAPMALWTLAAALYGRLGWLAVLLIACSWTRPEGAVLGGLLLIFALSAFRWGNPERKRFFRGLALAGLAGLGAYGTVALFNLWLTGTPSFHSVQGKGHFASFPFWMALSRTAEDAGALWREFFLGLGGGGRQFFAIPLAGLALMGLGAMALAQRQREKEASLENGLILLWWLGASVAATLLAASSGWQGIHFDRYFAWFLPVGLVLMATGANWLGERLAGKIAHASLAMAAGLLGWQLLGLAYFAGEFAIQSVRIAERIRFCQRADGFLPGSRRVGTLSGGGLAAYYLPRHKVRNLNGIDSGLFASPEPTSVPNIETLKHHPDWRPEVWLIAGEPEDWIRPFVGALLLEQSPVMGGGEMRLYAAQWKALDGAAEPLSAEARQAIAGRKLIETLDIGFREDESRLHHEAWTSVPALKIEPFVHVGDLAGREVAEVGRLILGSERFRLRVEPNRPLRVVLRTTFAGTPTFASRDLKTSTIRWGQVVRAAVLVDGVRAADLAMKPPREKPEARGFPRSCL
jgi:hypothetical protein